MHAYSCVAQHHQVGEVRLTTAGSSNTQQHQSNVGAALYACRAAVEVAASFAWLKS